MTPAEINKKIFALTLKHDRALEKLALQVQKEVVIPYCRKRGLRFSAGMGTWTFRYKNGKSANRSIHKNIRNLLNCQRGHWQVPLGSLMEDFDPSEYRTNSSHEPT